MFTMAGSANSTPSGCYPCVCYVKAVAMNTGYLASLAPRPTHPTSYVLSVRHGLQVPRVDTQALAAEMIKGHFRRNWPTYLLVGKAVGIDNLTRRKHKLPISVPSAGLPEPTPVWASLINLGPKSGGWGLGSKALSHGYIISQWYD